MTEPRAARDAQAAGFLSAMGEPIAAVRHSPDMRILQPSGFGGGSGTVEQFIAAVVRLAREDGQAAWTAAAVNAAAFEIGGAPEPVGADVWSPARQALVTSAYRGAGRLTGADRVLSGRWPSVPAARWADWFVLPADNAGSACRVLVARRDVDIAPVAGPASAWAEVTVTGVAVAPQHFLESRSGASISAQVLLSAGMAAAVAGAADGAWRAHVAQMKERLATSHGGAEVADQAPSTVHVAHTACDIDAAILQITDAAHHADDLAAAVRAHRQAVARAREAADTLMSAGRRHALDAADPVCRLLSDVHAGARLAISLFDCLDRQ